MNKEYIEDSTLGNWITSISNLAIAFSEILRSQKKKIIASSSMRYGKILSYLSYDVLRIDKDQNLPIFNPNVLNCFKDDFLVVASNQQISENLKEENVDVLIKFNQSFVDVLKKYYFHVELSSSLEKYGKAWYFIGGILNFGNKLQIRDMFSAVENFNLNFQFFSNKDGVNEYKYLEKLIHSLEEIAPHTVKLFFEGKI
jgi:hypothetical protein